MQRRNSTWLNGNVFAVLAKMEVCDEFLKFTCLLYTDPLACSTVIGTITAPIPISRGIQQG